MVLGEQYIRQAADILRRAMKARSAERDQLNHDIQAMTDEINRRQAMLRDHHANKEREIRLLNEALRVEHRALDNTIRGARAALQQLDREMSNFARDIKLLGERPARDGNEQREIDQLMQAKQNEVSNRQRAIADYQYQHEQALEQIKRVETVTQQKIAQLQNELSSEDAAINRVVQDLQRRIDQKRQPLNIMENQVRDLEQKAIEVEQAAQEVPSTVFG